MPNQNLSREQLDAAEFDTLKAAGTVFINERRRPLYFDGRFLDAADLKAEQNYFLQRQASLNLASGFGVIDGLEVARATSSSGSNRLNAFRINLAAGSGITPSGEIVGNTNAREINLADIGQIAELNATFGIGQVDTSEQPTPPLLKQAQIGGKAFHLSRTNRGLSALNLNQLGPQITGPFRVPPSSAIFPFPRPSGPTAPTNPVGNEPAWSQTGVFILGLRLVEYATGAAASYATSGTGTGKITREKAEIVEATAVTLIQYTNQLGERARSQIAHDIFVKGTLPQMPANVLPLAMIALDRGAIQWIDNALVRREIGENTSGVLGLQTIPRALRSAHLQQYDQQLTEVSDRASLRPGIAASSYFNALPAAGRLPKAAINPSDFTQSYFPTEIDVTLSVAPADEIAALLEDSLALAPIDLTQAAQTRENISLLLIIPLTRQKIAQLQQALATAGKLPTPIFRPTFPISVASPGLIAKRSPLEKLAFLNRVDPFIISRPSLPTVESLWRSALSEADDLWYVRQRNIPYQSAIVGSQVPLANDDTDVEIDLTDRLGTLNLRDRFTTLNASTRARADVIDLLSAPAIARSPILTNSALNALERATKPSASDSAPSTAEPRRLNPSDVLSISERFGDPQLGEGLNRLEAAAPTLANNPNIIRTLADTNNIVSLDRVARKLKPDELEPFSRELTSLAERGDTSEVNAFIRKRLEGQ